MLSDIRSVLLVLEAVLAEPDVRDADLVMVTGDHPSGPQPCEVLDRLGEEDQRARLVGGNADRELVALRRGQDIDMPDDVTPWAAEQLTEQHVEVLAALPHPLILEVNGFGPVVFCHGSPRRDDEVVLLDSPLSRWQAAFADLDPQHCTVVCGHAHMPFLRLVERRLVLHAGSIAMPHGRAGGGWALLNQGGVALRHTPIDIETAIASLVTASTYPQAQTWAEEYLRAANSDADAIAAFTPPDDRP